MEKKPPSLPSVARLAVAIGVPPSNNVTFAVLLAPRPRTTTLGPVTRAPAAGSVSVGAPRLSPPSAHGDAHTMLDVGDVAVVSTVGSTRSRNSFAKTASEKYAAFRPTPIATAGAAVAANSRWAGITSRGAPGSAHMRRSFA